MQEDEDELYSQTFICTDCKKECTAADGTWPRYDFDGNPIITTDEDWGILNFYCYDCAD